MIKVEYLLIVDQFNCNDTKSLINLLKSDSDIEVKGNKIEVDQFRFNMKIHKNITLTNESKTYFDCQFWIEENEDVEEFSRSLKRIRKILSVVNKFQYVMWDDVSLFYSKKAYEKIYYIENLMRKLVSKCMLVNLGMEWDSSRIPTDVLNTIKQKSSDVNILSNIDFIQLKNVLFSTNYPEYQSKLLDQLSKLDKEDAIDLEEIKKLLPSSNWNKYFADIIDCEAEFLEKRWKKLYDLRNSVAHNKQFSIRDSKEVDLLVDEIAPILEEAIVNISELNISEEDKSQIADSIAETSDSYASIFLSWFETLEIDLKNLYRQYYPEQVKNVYIPISEVIETIRLIVYLPDEIVDKIKSVYNFRNKLVHTIGLKVSEAEVDFLVADIEDILQEIRKKLNVDESQHLERIKDKAIIQLYQDLRDKILKLSEVELKINKHYISFIHRGIFTDLKPMQKSLKIWLNMKYEDVSDPDKITKDVSTIGHLGNGGVEFAIKSQEEIDYAFDLIRQSYQLSRK